MHACRSHMVTLDRVVRICHGDELLRLETTDVTNKTLTTSNRLKV